MTQQKRPAEQPAAQGKTGDEKVVVKDAATGQFVSEEEAAARPEETYHQTIEETIELSQAVQDVLDAEVGEGSAGSLVALAVGHAVGLEYDATGKARLRREPLVVAAARLIKAIELIDEERSSNEAVL